jgi:hypothetical protein
MEFCRELNPQVEQNMKLERYLVVLSAFLCDFSVVFSGFESTGRLLARSG